ncbi:hypothetical protein UA24_18520 [Marinomonas sp. BSi20414]|nr:hypothetical protein [Marinomonas sp. BSi20414]
MNEWLVFVRQGRMYRVELLLVCFFNKNRFFFDLYLHATPYDVKVINRQRAMDLPKAFRTKALSPFKVGYCCKDAAENPFSTLILLFCNSPFLNSVLLIQIDLILSQ